MTDIADLIQGALATDRARLKDMVRKLAKEQPDVFRRGVQAWLTPVDPKAERKALRELADPEVFMDAVTALEKETSAQEVDEILR